MKHAGVMPGGVGTGPVPGVLVLPPVAFVAALAAGIALEVLWPTTFIAGLARLGAGAGLFLGGAAVLWLGLAELRRHGTDPDPRVPDSALVSSGIYRFSRNPIYVGMFAVSAGIGVWADSVWIVVLLLPVWVIIRYGVIAREERHLQTVFGEPYRTYCSRVRRWA